MQQLLGRGQSGAGKHLRGARRAGMASSMEDDQPRRRRGCGCAAASSGAIAIVCVNDRFSPPTLGGRGGSPSARAHRPQEKVTARARSVHAELVAHQAQLGRRDELLVRHRHAEELAFEIVRPEIEEVLEAREARMHVVVLPDEALQQRGMIRQTVEDLRRRQAEARELGPKFASSAMALPQSADAHVAQRRISAFADSRVA